MEPYIESYIETFLGNKVYPLSPDPQSIKIVDIAHALSMLCRFNGHCKRFYSVAQHSINVAKELARHGYDPLFQLYGLLHDASEAYIADINRPAKSLLPDYKELEKGVQSAVWDAFYLPEPLDVVWDIVKYFDDALLHNEAKSLMSGKHWNFPPDYEVLPNVDLSERTPFDVAWEFVGLFNELYEWIRDDMERQYNLSKLREMMETSTTDDTKTDKPINL